MASHPFTTPTFVLAFHCQKTFWNFSLLYFLVFSAFKQSSLLEKTVGPKTLLIFWITFMFGLT